MSKKSPFARRLLYRVSALLIGLLVAVGLAEVVVRIFAPQHTSVLSCYRHHPTQPMYTLDSNVELPIDRGEHQYMIYSDEDGFRVPGDHDGASSKTANLVYGDSFTFGMGVEQEESFCGLLNDRFGGRQGFRNAGVPGHGPPEYRMRFEHHLSEGYRPNVVIVGVFTGNDFCGPQFSDDVEVIDGLPVGLNAKRRWLKQHSHLYRLTANLYHRWGGGYSNRFDLQLRYLKEAHWNWAGLKKDHETFRRELGRIAELAKGVSATPVVVMIPVDATVKHLEMGAAAELGEGVDLRLPARKIAADCRELGLELVDPTDRLVELGAEKGYFKFDQHLTIEGHQAVADALGERIEEILKER